MAIPFKTEAQQATFEKITPWIREIFGELAVSVSSSRPLVRISFGSAAVVVQVNPWRDNDAVINARAYVVTNIELTADLLYYLLKANDEMRFGAFGIDDANDIFFEYSIVGSTVDRNELKAAVSAVAFTADEYDDQIAARWGGERAIDR
jgi:hypothetical protein